MNPSDGAGTHYARPKDKLPVLIKAFEQGSFAARRPRRDPQQGGFLHEERDFGRAIMSPKAHAISCGVVTAARIWKIQHYWAAVSWWQAATISSGS
jgi:hypothetical protein